MRRARELLAAVALGALALALPAAPSAAGAHQAQGPSSERGMASAPLVPAPSSGAEQLAVERALSWLAERQQADGSWLARIGYKLNNDYQVDYVQGRDGSEFAPHVGVSALAGLAFLASGDQPGRGRHGERIERALDYVLACTQDDGFITHNKTRMYSHAFATLFLAEVYGMTWRADVRVKLQKAIDFIVQSQNEEGGWRYVPMAPDSDMSIVVCQILALRAARNIGIHVPRSTVDRAARYVVDSSITDDDIGPGLRGFSGRSELGAFRYQKGGGSRSSLPLAAAGVTALHGLGIYSNDRIRLGLDYIHRNHDGFNFQYGRQSPGHYFFWYGHYYAVQAMYTAGGSDWEVYSSKVVNQLLDMQLPDGSFPSRVGPGPTFATAMALLALQIPYRYLPIFQR